VAVTSTDPAVRREASSPFGEWADAVNDLISYRYLASRPRAVDRDRAENWVRVRRDLRAPAGGILHAPLAIGMLDTAGISVDPINVLALTQIDIHLTDPGHTVNEVHFSGSVTREARTQVFTECVIADAERPDRVLGFGIANWTIIVPTTGDFRYPEPGAGIPDSPDAPPLWQAYKGRRRADGRLEIPGLSSEIGTERLHHGPMLVLSEAAAIDAAAVPVDVEHLSMTIVSPGRVGPFVVTAEIFPGTGRALGSRVELRDEGNDNRLVARSFVQLRPNETS
jgi:acyl-coenzyme A thioesterase PaaI-like protein